MSRRSSDTFMGLDRQQLLGGLVLPAVLVCGTYLIKDRADSAAVAQAVQDGKEARNRELDDLRERIGRLEAECWNDR